MRVSVPTLVKHSRGNARVPFEEGNSHVLFENETACPVFMAEVSDFLVAVPAAAMHGAAAEPALTATERDVLRLAAQGLDNDAIARQLRKSEKTVRNQASSIFDKFGMRTRAQAIMHVRDRAPRDAVGWATQRDFCRPSWRWPMYECTVVR